MLRIIHRVPVQARETMRIENENENPIGIEKRTKNGNQVERN